MRSRFGVCTLIVLAGLALVIPADSSRAQQATPATSPGPADPEGMAAVNALLSQFDQVRALHARSLIRAQDLKTACLYGRSWGLDMPEAVPEDLLIEGLWLFDYLDSMDLSAQALVSYGIASQHPHLQQEIETFKAFLPQAAAQTAAYHDKVTKALGETLEKVRAAAQAAGKFEIQTLPAKPLSDLPAQKIVGDGLTLGYVIPVLPAGHYKNFLDRHNYTPERVLEMAKAAGVKLILPADLNVFDWADVAKEPGKFDWSKADEILTLLKKHDLALQLHIDTRYIMPPDWVVAKFPQTAVLTDAAGAAAEADMPNNTYLMGLADRRAKLQFLNLFDAQIAQMHAAYVKALITHIQEKGVTIWAVQLGELLPSYGGAEADKRLQAFLAAQKIDPRQRWGVDVDAAGVTLSADYIAKAQARPEGGAACQPAAMRLVNDLRRWREDEHFQYFKARVDAVRAVLPEVPIYSEIVGPFEFNDSITGRNDDRITKELGVVPWAYSTRNHFDDARRGLSPIGSTIASCSTGCGVAYTQYESSAFAHDALAILTGPYPIIRAFYHGEVLIYPDMRWEWSALYSYRRFHERAGGMAPEMLYTSPAPQVAILHSDTSGKYQGFIQDYLVWTYGPRTTEANYNRVEAIGWGHLLDCLHMAHDVVTEEQVRSGALGKYQMLVAPAAQALPADVAAKIKEFVEGGGTLVSTSALGLVGEDMETKGSGQLADVLGADFAGFRGHSTVAESPMNWPRCDSGLYNITAWTPNDAKAQANADSLRTLFCSFKPRQGATVLEKFTDGEPAVVMNAFGKGKAVAIGYPMGRECFLSDTYHMFYGNNWQECPDSSVFTQGLCNWLELLMGKLAFERQANVLEEFAPRSTSMDASWPSGFMPRAMQEYRDYVWQKGPGRSVEVILRKRQENPQTYVELYNRESAYGLAPGVVQFEASSKQVTFELRGLGTAKHVYDISLGCPVKV